ncbi:MAG: SUMF1/EgtB/PvdO family nonheme iron enzyme [Alphaproteobacteria bacterium]|nr:SUMF1/EgtB/PvdO family nonheme iron enzyme [Alphaproteobacteria bacterium]
MLDACRNNPFERRWRGGGGGLAQMNAPAGTMIAYATAPGAVAGDGDGIHSVYTAALLDAPTRPGLKAEEVFKSVRVEVARRTKNQQTPWESSSLTGDFVFNVAGKVTPAANGVVAPADREMLFWQSAQASNRAEEYEEYLKQFPQGMFAGLARSRIGALKAQPRLAAAPAPGAAPTKPNVAVEPIGKEYVVIQAARLHEAPDPKSRQLRTIKEGETLLVLGKVTDQPWLQVERRGEAPAYVSVQLVEEAAAHTKRREAEVQQAVAAPSPAPAAPLPPGRMPEVGRTFRDCPECPEMVVIPGGKFTMGSPPDEAERDDNEGPQSSVALRRFAAGKYEVTLAEWDACVSDGGCTHSPEDGGWGRGNRPAINVGWDDAEQYVKWLSRRTSRQYRLLSEAEWEYAARAGTRTPFHTGPTIAPDQANFNGNYTYGRGGKGAYQERTVDVGSFAPNQFGLYDMHGNVWEWVEDCYNASYAGAPTNGAAWASGDCGRRVLRGGSWCYNPGLLRSAKRDSLQTTVRYNVVGFRVATTD